MENRKCYTSELDPHYCDLIIKRYVEYTGDATAWVERDGKEVTLAELQAAAGKSEKKKK